MGQVYLNLLKFDEAEAHFNVSLGMIPNYAPALKGLKMLETISNMKISPMKVYEQIRPQLDELASGELQPSEDGYKLHFNIWDAIVDDPEPEG